MYVYVYICVHNLCMYEVFIQRHSYMYDAGCPSMSDVYVYDDAYMLACMCASAYVRVRVHKCADHTVQCVVVNGMSVRWWMLVSTGCMPVCDIYIYIRVYEYDMYITII